MVKKKQEVQTIKFLKSREVKSPERGHPTSAGIDFFVPRFNKSFIKDLIKKNPKIFRDSSNNISILENIIPIPDRSYTIPDENKPENILKFDPEQGLNYILLRPSQGLLIPSGLHCRMQEPNRALIAKNKSGIASKKGIIFGAQVIDYEYQGEIHINIINTSKKFVRIYEDMKVMQFIETPIFRSEIEISNTSLTEDQGSSKFDGEVEDFYKGHESERKSDGFGSTDKIQK